MDKQEKIQELQFLEANIQNLILQKQAFEMEFSETDSALRELENSSDEVYKIIGQIMIKSEKSKIKDELENKKKLISLRIKNFEKQENDLMKNVATIREEILSSGNKK